MQPMNTELRISIQSHLTEPPRELGRLSLDADELARVGDEQGPAEMFGRIVAGILELSRRVRQANTQR